MGPWAAQLGNYWSNRPAHIPFVKTLRSHWTHLQSKLSQKDCGLPSQGGLELDGGKGKFESARSTLKMYRSWLLVPLVVLVNWDMLNDCNLIVNIYSEGWKLTNLIKETVLNFGAPSVMHHDNCPIHFQKILFIVSVAERILKD